MRAEFYLFAVALCFVGASAGTLPSFIKACSSSDENLNSCIEDVIRSVGPRFTEGMPELGVMPLDPLELGTIVVDNPSLKLTFEDTIVTGLKGFKLNSYKTNAARNSAKLDFTANATLKANYDIDGQLLILPIRGNGPAKIKITNLNIVIKYDFDTRDGHWVVTNYKESYKMDRAYFKFNNLFNGNKALAETTHRFTNENWEIIIGEIAPPAIKSIIRSCVEVVNKFFGSVPAADLLLQR